MNIHAYNVGISVSHLHVHEYKNVLEEETWNSQEAEKKG